MRILGHIQSSRLLAGAVAAAVLGGAIQAWAVQPLIMTNSNKTARSAPANIYYSAGLADILKMVDAKVDPEVIKAFIKNSAVPYNPSSGEVIYLKNKGVPSDIITAMLQRGSELRAQAAQGQQYAQGPQYPGAGTAGMPPYPYPPYGYGADYGLYPADYGYGYPYAYGGYPYGWWWSSFWPFFGFDDFDHHHHRGDWRHVNEFNRFNNFRHAQFQSFGSSPFNNARFQNFDFNRFNRSFAFTTPRVGISHLGVPSRAFGPGAFAGGSANAAFIGAPGGSAGMVRAPGIVGVRTGGGAFAVRGGGGGGHGGGGGGHR